MRSWRLVVAGGALAVCCGSIASAQRGPSTLQPATREGAKETRFAIIGDYGCYMYGCGNPPASSTEGKVAALVDSWNPDFIATTGDNNYKTGQWATIDGNIGQFYCKWIYPYAGSFCADPNGPAVNRFWPVLGNHDCTNNPEPPLFPTGYNCAPYLAYFTLPSGPGNERYYETRIGEVHLFMLDTTVTTSAIPQQTQWLAAVAPASDAAWKFAVGHRSPYGTPYEPDDGSHGSYASWQLDYDGYGIDAFIGGHNHNYEYLNPGDGVHYFVNGAGGQGSDPLGPPIPQSACAKSDVLGAQLVTVKGDTATFEFWDVNQGLLNRVVLKQSGGQTVLTTMECF